MIIRKSIELDLSQNLTERLMGESANLMEHLESGFPITQDRINSLQNELTWIVQGHRYFQEILQNIHSSGNHYAVSLIHSHNEILNLPWDLAIDRFSNKRLGDIDQLILTKSLSQCRINDREPFKPTNPLPLKILVMISSPKDSPWHYKLSYEEEEARILVAFNELLPTGQVVIDFTNDGSLDSLKEKVLSERYHILHFSGHGFYRKDGFFFLLEDPLSLNGVMVNVSEFIETLSLDASYKIPLIVLSACHTARRDYEKGLAGITDRLLMNNFVSVISMGMAIKDRSATSFAASFYQQIAIKTNLLDAFKSAIKDMKGAEERGIDSLPVKSNHPPLQWINPNLYLSRHIEHIMDWNASDDVGSEVLPKKSFASIPHGEHNLFIGRREDKANILGPLFNRIPILLKGVGGVGKTAMAGHLVERLIIGNPRIESFIFTEMARSLKEIVDRLYDFLLVYSDMKITLNLSQFESGFEWFLTLLYELEKICEPVFVFDALDIFQKRPGEEFSDEFKDIEKIIRHLCKRKKYYLILTSRFPLKGFENIETLDLNHVSLNDFWKKCEHLWGSKIRQYMDQQDMVEKNFFDFVNRLYGILGGNYRALEIFNQAFKREPHKILESLNSLKSYRKDHISETEEVLREMGQYLVFSNILEHLDQNQLVLIEILTHFRIPVQELAIALQCKGNESMQGLSFKNLLESLDDLSLVEISRDRETGILFYYLPPIIKELLNKFNPFNSESLFSSYHAGEYHYSIYNNMFPELVELEEAFYHFYNSGSKEKVEMTGEIIARFYKDASMYHNVFHYCIKVHEILKEETGFLILNLLGIACHILGRYNEALEYYKEALSKCNQRKRK